MQLSFVLHPSFLLLLLAFELGCRLLIAQHFDLFVGVEELVFQKSVFFFHLFDFEDEVVLEADLLAVRLLEFSNQVLWHIFSDVWLLLRTTHRPMVNSIRLYGSFRLARLVFSVVRDVACLRGLGAGNFARGPDRCVS